jgi:hypothetical protein
MPEGGGGDGRAGDHEAIRGGHSYRREHGQNEDGGGGRGEGSEESDVMHVGCLLDVPVARQFKPDP